MKKLLLFWLLCGIAAVFVYSQAQKIINEPIRVEGEKIILIKSGASPNKIAEILVENNLIKEKWHFILYSKINKIYPKIKAGEYSVKDDISLAQLANLLTSGKTYLRKITFAEGLTSREIADILADDEYMKGDFGEIAEGTFLPETYTYSREESRQHIVNQATKAMVQVLQEAWDERDAGLPLNSKEEMLVLASIVEKETGIATERPMVASVFINRLRKGMLLQTDPTVIYALTLGKTDLKRNLTFKDLETDSPYNTYKYEGLPPAPICNPGKAAIMAVAHPDKTPYLYFVASGNGGHNFARTLEEHNRNVKHWRAINK